MAVLGKLVNWWRLLPFPWRLWRVLGYVDASDEIPAELCAKGVILVGSPSRMTWAAFDCPCQMGHRLMLNLDSSRHPCWIIDALEPLTIRPSVDHITSELRCHFLVCRGKITWVHNDRRMTS